MPRPKLIFVNRYFHPDHSATAQILSDLAFDLARRGWPVTVITSRGSYDGRGTALLARDTVKGVNVHRVWTSGFGRKKLIGRAVDYLSFYLSAFVAAIRLGRRGDLFIAKTDPPMLCSVIGIAARLRGAQLINWLQDLYPEVAGRLGIRFAEGTIGKLLRAIRNRSLRTAAMNVAIGELMAERIRSERVPADRIAVLPNWTDDEQIRPAEDAGKALRRAWAIEADFVIGYSGNLGRAHDIETIIGAAERLRDDSRIKFLFIGAGNGLDRLARRVEGRGLSQFLFKPYQPREQLVESLAVPDVHWLTLLPDLEGLIVPSKCYGIAAVARPLLFVGSLDGEIARLIRDHRCGASVSAGEPDQLAGMIRALASDRARCAELGRAARAMLDAHYSRRRTLDSWHRLLQGATATRA